MPRRVLSCLVGLVLALCGVDASLAHRQKAGLTTIERNSRTTELEIVHRLHWHDAYQALDLKPEDEEGLAQGQLPEQLEPYMRSAFSMRYEAGQALDLRYIGAEKDGQHLFVYFVSDEPRAGEPIIVDNRLLVDYDLEQSNLTNIKLGEGFVSLLQNADRRRPGRVRF